MLPKPFPSSGCFSLYWFGNLGIKKMLNTFITEINIRMSLRGTKQSLIMLNSVLMEKDFFPSESPHPKKIKTPGDSGVTGRVRPDSYRVQLVFAF